jgi:hypothetical protein
MHWLVVFWIIYGCIAIVGTIFFYLMDNHAALKRRLWPWYIVLTGVLFLALLKVAGFRLWVVLLMSVPAVGFGIVNYRRIRFCPKCGTISIGMLFLRAANVCSACGTPLDNAGDHKQVEH